MREICPIIVLAHAQVGAVAGVFLVLNSRVGCVVAALHAIFMIISINTYHFQDHLRSVMNVKPDTFLEEGEEPAFGPSFWRK